jgi:hypothetical protein
MNAKDLLTISSASALSASGAYLLGLPAEQTAAICAVSVAIVIGVARAWVRYVGPENTRVDEALEAAEDITIGASKAGKP